MQAGSEAHARSDFRAQTEWRSSRLRGQFEHLFLAVLLLKPISPNTKGHTKVTLVACCARRTACRRVLAFFAIIVMRKSLADVLSQDVSMRPNRTAPISRPNRRGSLPIPLWSGRVLRPIPASNDQHCARPSISRPERPRRLVCKSRHRGSPGRSSATHPHRPVPESPAGRPGTEPHSMPVHLN
jgi:hypothetical protein